MPDERKKFATFAFFGLTILALGHFHSETEASMYITPFPFFGRAEPFDLQFREWGATNELSLDQIKGGFNLYSFNMTGTVGNSTSGFASEDFTADPQSIILAFGNVSKDSAEGNNDTQVSVTFLYTNESSTGQVNYVLGPLNVAGKQDNQTYIQANPHETYILDTRMLSEFEGYHLKNIHLIVQHGSVIDHLDFALAIS